MKTAFFYSLLLRDVERKRISNQAKEQRKYQSVDNEKGEKVRGQWKRYGHYYAQLDASGGNRYRYRLAAETVPQAVLRRQVLNPAPLRPQPIGHWWPSKRARRPIAEIHGGCWG